MSITVQGRTIPDSPGPLDADPDQMEAILTGIEEFVAWARQHQEEVRLFRHGHAYIKTPLDPG